MGSVIADGELSGDVVASEGAISGVDAGSINGSRLYGKLGIDGVYVTDNAFDFELETEGDLYSLQSEFGSLRGVVNVGGSIDGFIYANADVDLDLNVGLNAWGTGNQMLSAGIAAGRDVLGNYHFGGTVTMGAGRDITAAVDAHTISRMIADNSINGTISAVENVNDVNAHRNLNAIIEAGKRYCQLSLTQELN